MKAVLARDGKGSRRALSTELPWLKKDLAAENLFLSGKGLFWYKPGSCQRHSDGTQDIAGMNPVLSGMVLCRNHQSQSNQQPRRCDTNQEP